MSARRTGILVVQSLGLGDVLFALPALKVLARTYARERITFLTSARNSTLLSLVPEVSETISYGAKTITGLRELLVRVRRKRFRMVFVLNPVFRGALIAWASGAPIRVGYVRDFERTQTLGPLGRLILTHRFKPEDRKIHEVDRHLDILRAFGLPVDASDRVPRLQLDDRTCALGRSVVNSITKGRHGPVVVVNVGAQWNRRRWPEPAFAEVADWLIDRYDARVIFVGGETEREIVLRINKQMRHPAASYVGKTTLPDLAGIIGMSDLFLTNDTGALHVGAALDVQTVALFGPGDPVKVRPLSERAVTLHHPVPCSPCRVQYTTLCHDSLCMSQISVTEVKEVASKMLAGNAVTTGPAPVPAVNAAS